MGDNDNRLLLAGLFSGFVAGVLGALLVRQRAEHAPPPPPQAGLVLRRTDEAAERARRLAGEVAARVEGEAGALLGGAGQV
ncbi:MAG: hypothetical protein RLZZ387_5741 [Chloroflexota bacterium]|jgi:hypothetical protein